MTYTNKQKCMIGCPIVFAIALCSIAIPIAIAIAVRADNPAWLLLWVAGASVTGLACATLEGWVNG